MNPQWWRRPWRARAAGLLLVALAAGPAGGAARAQAPPSCPVEKLRQALRDVCPDAAARDRRIKECLEELRSLADLHRALTLAEWRDGHTDGALSAADQANRAAVAQRFTQAARAALQGGDPVAVNMTLDLLVKMARADRTAGEPPGLASRFGPDLAALARQGRPGVRAAAARALGEIEPDVAVAAPALGDLLQAPDATLRQAAAQGLAGLLRAVTQVGDASGEPAPARAPRAEVVRVAAGVLPAARRGLQDWHPEVRRRLAGALALAAGALARLTSDPGEAGNEAEARQRLEAERAELLPLARALRDEAPALARALRDADVEVRLLAQKALEEMAQAHRRWVRQRAALVAQGPEAGADDPLLDGLRGAVPGLGGAVADPDVRVRRAAIDVLEMLGPLAEPAAPALAQALNDSDRFVRWSAIRTLSRLGPAAAPWALPGLARLLEDEDLDVRLAAATALRHLEPPAEGGPVRVVAWSNAPPASDVARTALPALLRALRTGDAEMRLAALRTLRTLRVDPRPALPALYEALGDPDARVRRSAVETVGAFGPAARDAAGFLRRALQDGDADVRQAASEALLNVLGPGRKE
jgi:HEAT repeat protein